jgi:long-chain acyl-CoA synthetase
MLGYWNNEVETKKVFASTGHLLTGDMGYVTPEGVYLLGRKKNVINSGGYKIWPDEVERVLLENEHVKELAVIGVHDELYGEAVKAYVVPNGLVTVRELKGFCRKRLSSYKVPRQLVFCESLPKSSVGKILHRVLRENKGPVESGSSPG